jgi:hypothetical protein
MPNQTPSGNEVSTGSEPYTLRVEMRVVDPTLPRYGTDLMTLQNELLHMIEEGHDAEILPESNRNELKTGHVRAKLRNTLILCMPDPHLLQNNYGRSNARPRSERIEFIGH